MAYRVLLAQFMHETNTFSKLPTTLDDYRLGGRVIVVTGASSGLGMVAAEQFATCGATVVLLGRDRAGGLGERRPGPALH